VPCYGVQCVLALLAIIGVFVCVPRGINVGTISVSTTRMTFNSTTKTYRIILQADVPIYNPNYLKVCVGRWYWLWVLGNMNAIGSVILVL
jgi:hypothetical protein